MKHYILYLIGILMLPHATGVLAQSTALSDTENENVRTLMDQYFGTLVNGDVGTLRTLLGGRLEAKRTRLLNNPDYAAHLATAHINASFEILGIKTTDSGAILVNARISFSPEESINKIYTLKKIQSLNGEGRYRIIGETAVSN